MPLALTLAACLLVAREHAGAQDLAGTPAGVPAAIGGTGTDARVSSVAVNAQAMLDAARARRANGTAAAVVDPRLQKAAQQLQGTFALQMLQAMRATVPADGLTSGGSAEQMFTGLMDQVLGDQMAAGWSTDRLQRTMLRQLTGQPVREPDRGSAPLGRHDVGLPLGDTPAPALPLGPAAARTGRTEGLPLGPREATPWPLRPQDRGVPAPPPTPRAAGTPLSPEDPAPAPAPAPVAAPVAAPARVTAPSPPPLLPVLTASRTTPVPSLP